MTTVPPEAAPGPELRSRRGFPAWALGVAVVTVAAASRIGRNDLWLDEAFSVAATHRLRETLEATHGTMAAYYAVLTPWSWISTSPTWLRALSTVFMAAGVAVFAATVARQAGTVAGWTAGLLGGSSALVVRYAVEARSYSLVVFLSALGWYALDRTIAAGRPSAWSRLAGLVVVLLPLAHGLASLQVIAMAGAVVWARPAGRVVRELAVAFVLSGLVLVFLLATGAGEVGNWVPPVSMASVLSFLGDVTHPWPPLALFVTLFAGKGLAHVLRTATADPLGRFRQVTLLFWGPGSAAALIALSVARPSLLSRYAVPAALGVAGLAAIGITRLQPSRLVGPVAGTLAALMLLTQWPTTDPVPTWSRAVAIVDAEARDGDGIVFGAPDARIPFEAAWEHGPATELQVLGPGDPLGTYDRFGAVTDADALVGDVLGGTRVWVIEQPYLHQESRFDDLLDHPDIRAQFDVADRWTLPAEIEIVLLERRASP